MLELTAEIARELLDYNLYSGSLTWKSRDRRWFISSKHWKWWNGRFYGKVAGSPNSDGYILVGVFGTLYKAHRLAWLMTYGVWHKEQIDHINHIPSDNRMSNLRGVSSYENSRNQTLRSDNTSGCFGVCWHKSTGKWVSRITVKRKRIHLGLFTDKREAIRVRKKAEVAHGFHENHGVIPNQQEKASD